MSTAGNLLAEHFQIRMDKPPTSRLGIAVALSCRADNRMMLVANDGIAVFPGLA